MSKSIMLQSLWIQNSEDVNDNDEEPGWQNIKQKDNMVPSWVSDQLTSS